jgi:hypothetical protein
LMPSTRRWTSWSGCLKLTVRERRLELFLNTDQVDTHVLGTESLLELCVSGFGKSLQENFSRVLHIVKVVVKDCLLDFLPSKGRLKVGNLAAIDLSGTLALKSRVAFLEAVFANLRRLVRAIRGTVANLLTSTAGSSELSGNSLIGALRLGVT